MPGAKASRGRRSLGINVAIVTGLVFAPVVVATGFLTERAGSGGPTALQPLWPELRGTFEDAADTAAPAAFKPSPL